MKRIFAVALGVLTAIGGFVDIGDIVTNALVGSQFGLSLAWVVVLGVVGIVCSPRCLDGSRRSAAVPRRSRSGTARAASRRAEPDHPRRRC